MLFLTPKSSHRYSPEEHLLRRLLRVIKGLLKLSTGTTSARCDARREDGGNTNQQLIASNKRQNPRIHLANTAVYVTDGCLFATARIDNISLCGICLCNLPEQLYRSARQLTVFSSDNPGIPILHVQPKWESTSWSGKTIGAMILNTSETWRLFFIHAAHSAEN